MRSDSSEVESSPSERFQLFLSVVVLMRNQEATVESLVRRALATVEPLVSDFELVVVDNGSTDNGVAVLKRLCESENVANLQIYALTKEVDRDIAAWAGVENALGDFVAVVDPLVDDISFLPTMLASAASGSDVVFARNRKRPKLPFVYECGFRLFNQLYKWFNDIDLADQAPHFRILSRRVVNFILQHRAPPLSYRHLPATSGFVKANLEYERRPGGRRPSNLFAGIDKGLRMLVHSTHGPMRLVTVLSTFGAVANLAYSIYVIAIALFKADVAAGWVTLSLQQSGMFFLLSLVLMVLGEYIVHMLAMSNDGPKYHVAQEFTSRIQHRRSRLNVESAELAAAMRPEAKRASESSSVGLMG